MSGKSRKKAQNKGKPTIEIPESDVEIIGQLHKNINQLRAEHSVLRTRFLVEEQRLLSELDNVARDQTSRLNYIAKAGGLPEGAFTADFDKMELTLI